MSRIPPSQLGTTPYERVMGHAPHIPGPWRELENVFFRRSQLPADLLEQVRRTLALEHGCAYCRSKGGRPADEHSSVRTAKAVEFARVYASGHKNVDECPHALHEA